MLQLLESPPWARTAAAKTSTSTEAKDGIDRDAEGNLMEHDGEQMYGITSEGEVVMVQRFVFDPLIRPLRDLQLEKLPLVASAVPMPTN